MDYYHLKVLVSDDSPLIREHLKQCLLASGISNVFEAVDGQSAVEMYKQHLPDLVFMDIVMPLKDGIEALKEILSLNSEAKIVMASTSGTKLYLKKALEAGAYEFIQKPFDEEQVKKIIENLIK